MDNRRRTMLHGTCGLGNPEKKRVICRPRREGQGCAPLGGGGGLGRDPPNQNLGKPRDPELSNPHRGGGGLDSQPLTHPATKAVHKTRALDQF